MKSSLDKLALMVQNDVAGLAYHVLECAYCEIGEFEVKLVAGDFGYRGASHVGIEQAAEQLLKELEKEGIRYVD